MAPTQKADLVFEGGGVKGIGLVGAYSVIEQHYVPANVAGTSAGAIVGAMVAAGYTAAEMKKIMDELDYNRFKDKGKIDRIPVFGPLVSLLSEKGIYEGDFVEQFVRDLLRDKKVHTFGDLIAKGYEEERYKYRLNVIAADITNERLVVLPQGLRAYGLDPDRFDVAKAVRMSMSIPIFFEPVVIAKTYFVDGGLLSNFPIWLFDSVEPPAWPTFGIKLLEPDSGRPHQIDGPVDFVKAIIGTMMEAHDKMHVENDDIPRTIGVPTGDVRTTEFDIKREKSERLYASGVTAAQDFFSKWNFDRYKAAHRETRNEKWVAKVATLRRQLVT